MRCVFWKYCYQLPAERVSMTTRDPGSLGDDIYRSFIQICDPKCSIIWTTSHSYSRKDRREGRRVWMPAYREYIRHTMHTWSMHVFGDVTVHDNRSQSQSSSIYL